MPGPVAGAGFATALTTGLPADGGGVLRFEVIVVGNSGEVQIFSTTNHTALAQQKHRGCAYSPLESEHHVHGISPLRKLP